MVTEIAQFTAQPGKADELLAGLRSAMDVIRGAEGCLGIALRRCIEEPDAFIYEIQWETLDHHIVLFLAGSSTEREVATASPSPLRGFSARHAALTPGSGDTTWNQRSLRMFHTNV